MLKNLMPLSILSLVIFASCRSEPSVSNASESCRFIVSVFELDEGSGKHKLVTRIGPFFAKVPCKSFAVEHPTLKEVIQLNATGLTRYSVNFDVIVNDELQSLTAKCKDTYVDFDDGKLRVEIGIENTSLSPFDSTDSVLNESLCLYEIDYLATRKENADISVQGFKINETIEIKDQKTIDKIRSHLVKSENFRRDGADCFRPKTALRFGNGAETAELLFCLECSWVYVYAMDGENPVTMRYGLGDELHDLIVELRSRYLLE